VGPGTSSGCGCDLANDGSPAAGIGATLAIGTLMASRRLRLTGEP
jgi:hypothetical protein